MSDSNESNDSTESETTTSFQTTVFVQNVEITSGGKAQYESADGETIVNSYVEGAVFGETEPFEYAEFTFGKGDVNLTLDKTTTNYAVYETPNGAITGLYLHLDVFGDESAPEEVAFTLGESDEETFSEEKAEAKAEEQEAIEEEASALLG